MSFFADLIGSVAESGAKGLGEISARNQREDEARLQNDLAIERSKAAEAIRLDLEEKQRQAKQQRISEQNQAVERATPAVTQARELSSAQKRAPSVDGNVLDTIKARLSPEQVSKYYGVDNSPVAAIDDRLGIARKGGMYEAEDMLQAARKETVATMQAAQKERYQERSENRKDDILLQTIRRGDQQHGESMARIDASEKRQAGGDRQTQVEKLTTEKARALQELSILMDKGNRKTDGPRIEQIKANLVELDDMLSARRAPGEKTTPKPAPAAAPAAAVPPTWKQIGTSGGKPVYQDSITGKKYQ